MENEEKEEEKYKKRIITYTNELEKYKDIGTPIGEQHEDREEINETLRDLIIC